jgi:hypothetical protein
MIGPAVAGLLIAQIGIGWMFILNGLSFGAVLISMCFFRLSELHARVRSHIARQPDSWTGFATWVDTGTFERS